MSENPVIFLNCIFLLEVKVFNIQNYLKNEMQPLESFI